jgi:hypothetical protein
MRVGHGTNRALEFVVVSRAFWREQREEFCTQLEKKKKWRAGHDLVLVKSHALVFVVVSRVSWSEPKIALGFETPPKSLC